MFIQIYIKLDSIIIVQTSELTVNQLRVKEQMLQRCQLSGWADSGIYIWLSFQNPRFVTVPFPRPIQGNFTLYTNLFNN